MIITIRTLGVRHSGNDAPETERGLIGRFTACPSDGKLPEIEFDAPLHGTNTEEITAGIRIKYAEELKRETERELTDGDLIIFFV